ncbi:MAG TPA: T9SS type B sorting domain-containing protein, partial [Bacteroidetes bacterium]|nr:T9SS type B sorting domain-containing protein [Bacteroidota bacterium]
PITIDNFSLKQYENDPVSGETGPCVNVNTDEAFAVVYLNEIELTNLNNNTGTSGCAGSVEVGGGLPEFDDSDYTVSIRLVGNPSVQGSITNGPVTHGGTIEFIVPAPGLYNIVVEDGKSCGSTLLVNMTGCINMTQSIAGTIAAPTDNICLEVTVEGGFEAIVSTQYAITFDPAVLQYSGVQNLTPLLPNFTQSSLNFQNDTLRLVWFQSGGSALADGTVLFEICFDVVGPDGACTNVSFSELGPLTAIEIIDANDNELGFNGIPGLVCVSNGAVQATAIQDSVSCPGASDGGFELTVTGGMPPYTVTWQNAMGGPVFGPGTINVDGGALSTSNLPEGIYIITITDNSAMPITAIEQVQVLGPPALNILFGANPGPCNGDPGSVSATLILDSVIVSDVSNYTFNWSNGATTPSVSNITSGNYTLTVTDNTTGCTIEDMVFLPQAALLNVGLQVDSATCTGISDGVISVSVSGGTPFPGGNYQIELGPSSVMNSTASLMTQAGMYHLAVTDANGCVFEEEILLPAIKVLSITPLIDQVDCSGDCNGSIFAQGTTAGGVPATPYTFTWSGMPNPPPSIDQPTNTTLNNLCVGTYTVVMEDTDGCRVDSTFSISQPSPLQVTLVEVVNETCQPGMDGSITIAVSGGAYPYTYDWNNSSTDSIATGLMAGVYTVVVTDSEGCFESLMAEVQTPSPPVILSLNDDMIDCANGTDGTLTVVPANPSDIIQYAWSNGGLTETITGLSPGEYIVTITNSNQCTAEDTAYVNSPPPLMLDSMLLTPPVCVGNNNGQIIAFVSGGTMPYDFQWSDPNAPSGPVYAFATAGPNSVTVTDANGCAPLVVDTILQEPPSIVASFTAIDSVSCANTGMTCDGMATATAQYSDGTTGTFNFTWLNSGESASNTDMSTAVQLCQGDQPLIVADQTCVDTFVVNIPAPPPITPGQSIENVSCNGLSDGQITLLPAGGTPPYSIVWGNGTTGPILSGLPVGLYTAVITDSKNCTFTHTVAVTEPEPLELLIDGTLTQNVSCAGEQDGRIAVIVQGGNIQLGGETYLWQNNAGPIDSRVADGLPAGTWSVTVVDAKGCEAELTHTIEEPQPIGFVLGDIPPIDCFGGTTSITVDSAWGGTGLLRFRVDGGPPQNIGQPVGGFLALEHLITVFDANGCSEEVSVNIDQPLEIVVELPEVVEIELGDSLTSLDPVIVSSVPIDTFIWSPPSQLSCTDCKNPRVNPVDDQLYTLVVVDINGCTGMGQVYVDLDRNRNVFIPNIFSPNGDGINDVFKVYTGPGVTAIHFVRIYDRWGDKILDVTSPIPSPDGTAPWDGTFKGQEMNPAVFLYLIEVEFLDGQVLLYRGDITLVK